MGQVVRSKLLAEKLLCDVVGVKHILLTMPTFTHSMPAPVEVPYE